MLAPVRSSLALLIWLWGPSASVFAQAPHAAAARFHHCHHRRGRRCHTPRASGRDDAPRGSAAAIPGPLDDRGRAAAGATIHVGRLASLRRGPLASRLTGAAPGPEGYRISTAPDSLVVAGADERGVLFGVGRLLRALEIAHERVAAARRRSTSPRRPSWRCVGISSATGPRPIPTTRGTSRNGNSTSATSPSSAPTRSS